MSWADSSFELCERCNNKTGYVSHNCNTGEWYFTCNACGTTHNHVLKRDEKEKPIWYKDEYPINEKIGFLKINSKMEIVEFRCFDKTITDEVIKDWSEKDSAAFSSRLFGKSEVIDEHRYVIGIIGGENPFYRIFGKITVENRNGKKYIISEYVDYENKSEEGLGVAKIVEGNSFSFFTIKKDTPLEQIEELKKRAIESNGYFTSWNDDKKELIVECGVLDTLESFEKSDDYNDSDYNDVLICCNDESDDYDDIFSGDEFD